MQDKEIVVAYKNYVITMKEINYADMICCNLYKDGKLISHYTASKNYTIEQATEQLKFLYKEDVKEKVLSALKPRIKLKESVLQDKEVCFVEASGFVFKGEEEYQALKVWLEDKEEC